MFFKNKIDTDEILKIIQKKHLFKRYISLIIGCLLSAIAFNLCFLPNNIVYGGISGVSIVINRVLSIDPSLFILISSVILLIISYFTLGVEKTKGSIIGSLLFPLCVKLTSNLGTYIDFNIDNLLLLILFGAILTGLGSGITFKSGFTTGGTDIVNQIMSKYGKISMGKSILLCDGFILLGSGFFLNNSIYAWENVLYAVIVLYIISIITDKVILEISNSKAFYIITEHETEVKKFILEHLSHGITVLDARGGFTGNRQKVIMCIIPTREYFLAKEAIKEIDPKAFFLITDAYEVAGGE